MGFTLDDLDRIIGERAGSDPKKSYSAQLLDEGTSRCARKFGEEALELVISALEADRAGTRNEAADVLYHLLILLRVAGVELDEVMDELQKRTSRSGMEEKASR